MSSVVATGKADLQVQDVRRGSRLLRWLRRALIAFAALILAFILTGLTYEAISEAVDRANYPPYGQMLDVGGFKMHIHCTGEGSPTVILISASLDTVSDWVWVQEELTKVTRVCAYDRAGIGWSDPSPNPPDTEQNATDLHTLLQRANATGPYVLVGHSFGGLFARTYAHRYPDQVAGMVLVEGTHPDFPSRLGQPETLPNSDPGMLAIGPFAARLGILRLLGFIPIDTNLPARQQAELGAYYSSPKVADYSKRLYDAFPAMLAQVRNSGNLGSKPLIVVVGGASENATGTLAELQNEQLDLSTNSAKLIVEGADHVSLVRKQEHAQETSKAILKVVEAVRMQQTLVK